MKRVYLNHVTRIAVDKLNAKWNAPENRMTDSAMYGELVRAWLTYSKKTLRRPLFRATDCCAVDITPEERDQMQELAKTASIPIGKLVHHAIEEMTQYYLDEKW